MLDAGRRRDISARSLDDSILALSAGRSLARAPTGFFTGARMSSSELLANLQLESKGFQNCTDLTGGSRIIPPRFLATGSRPGFFSVSPIRREILAAIRYSSACPRACMEAVLYLLSCADRSYFADESNRGETRRRVC